MIDRLDRMLGRIERLFLWTGCAFLTGLVLLVGAQAALRYTTNLSIIWAGEVEILLFIWSVFLTAVVLHRRMGHITVSVVADRLTGRAARFAKLAVSLGIIVFCAFVFAQIVRFWPILGFTTTAILEIPNTWHAAALGLCLAVVLAQELVTLSRTLGSESEADS